MYVFCQMFVKKMLTRRIRDDITVIVIDKVIGVCMI